MSDTYTACVYTILSEAMVPQYVGLTRNLRSRMSSRKSTSKHRSGPFVGVRYFVERSDAESFEAAQILRLDPPLNGTRYTVEQTAMACLSGLPPYNARPMTPKEMVPPYYYAEVFPVVGFDRLFWRDADSEAAGFDPTKNIPIKPPARRTPPEGWDGILLDADGKPVHEGDN